MRRLGKWALRAIVLLLSLCLLSLGLVALVLDTERGTRWALARVSAALPGELIINEPSGTLWRGVHVQDLVYTDARQRIAAVDVDLELNWPVVATGRVALRSLSARSISRSNLVPTPQSTPLRVSMRALPLAVTVSRGAVGQLLLVNGDVRQQFDDATFEYARVDGTTIRARRASVTTRGIDIAAARFEITLSGDVPLAAKVRWRLVNDSWSGEGSVRGSLAELSFDQSVAGRLPGSASGSIRLLDRTEPEIDALLNWDRWILGGREFVDGELRIRGTRERYDAEADVTVMLDDGSPYRLTGTGTGDLRELAAFSATLAGAAGQAQLAGRLAWQPELAATARVQVSDFDAAALHQALSGKLAATANVTLDDTRVLDITGLDVKGQLNAVTLSASGDLSLAPGQQRCSACVLQVGPNRLQIDGVLTADRPDLSLVLMAPQLEQLWPGLDGRATARGSVGGTLQQPEMRFDADWRYGDVAVTAGGEIHRQADAVSGRIRSASVSEPSAGDWMLDTPFGFRLGAGTLQVDAHQWSGTNGALRITRFVAQDAELELVAALERLPLQLGNRWLPDNVELLGDASIGVALTRSAGLWNGTVQWQQSGTVLRATGINDQVTDVRVPRAEMMAEFRDGGVRATAALTIDPGVQGELSLQLERLEKNAQMQGELRMHGADWGWLTAVMPQIDRLEGAISAAVNATGPLNAPQFSGTVEWHDGRLLVPALNVPLRDIDIVIAGASNGEATVRGTAKAGDGKLEVDGEFRNLMLPSRSLHVAVTGKSAELLNWPEYHLWGTPKLDLSGDSSGWKIAGELAVPRAEVSLREAPVGAVEISPDVVVLGEDETAPRQTRVTGQTRVLLGDNVRVSALGLDTRLTGSVLLTLAENREPVAEGRLSLVDGTFGAHNQKLTIRRGELTFTGPLDDPLVDVRAVRVIDTLDGTVTAGLHLRGRAKNLVTSVFAEPAMADADALSYLVIGRPLSQATESDGGNLSGAAVALGLRQATRVTEQIGQAVGLDQLSLAGDGGDTTALVAGKQLNSRLYARYAYGVFSRLGTLLMRYRMSRGLVLEAGAGENQSIDVLYTIEK